MPSMVTPTTGQTVVAEMWAQLTEAWSGLRNIPMSLTGINDATAYAQTIKNAGTGSKAQIIYAADGTTVLLQVDGAGVKASPDGSTAATTILTAAGAADLTGKTYAATKTGAVAGARFVGATASGAPVTGTFQTGDFVIDLTGKIWINTAAGSPGTWVQVGGTLPSASNILGADVALNNTANYFDGPSMVQGTVGTWLAIGQVTVTETGNANLDVKLHDGTTVMPSLRTTVLAAFYQSITIAGILVSPVANIRISVKDVSSVNGNIKFNVTGNSKDSSIWGVRIA